jgi:rod shape-determining protein MreD
MANTYFARLWLGRLTFFAVAWLLLALGLVPLGFTPRFVPPPDLLLGLVFAFMLRRPDFLPVWLVALVFFLSDLLQMRPLGLWTAIVVLAMEFTRNQEHRLRELAFPFEWAFVGAIMFLAMVSDRLILSLLVVPQAGFGTLMLHFLTSFLAYPLVVLFCFVVLRLHKVPPHEAISFGGRP